MLDVSGGEVGGRSFYVAAILGAPALWADAREAMRKGKLRLAVLRARPRLPAGLQGTPAFHSGRWTAEQGRGADLDVSAGVAGAWTRMWGWRRRHWIPRGALDGFRLGLSTLVGRWREDPAVQVTVCQRAETWAHGRVPGILDGEPHRFTSPVKIAYRPKAFRALVPDETAKRCRRAALWGEQEASKTARSAAVAGVGEGYRLMRVVQLSDIHFGAVDRAALEAATAYVGRRATRSADDHR